MPTYEYLCVACHHRFETRQRFKDAPLTTCPECQGRIARVFHVPLGIHFKGNGWYSTDNRPKGNGTSSRGKKSEEPSAEEPSAKEEGSEPAPSTAVTPDSD